MQHSPEVSGRPGEKRCIGVSTMEVTSKKRGEEGGPQEKHLWLSNNVEYQYDRLRIKSKK